MTTIKEPKLKGMYAEVFKGASGVDCSMNGITNQHKYVYLVTGDPDIDHTEVPDGAPVLFLHRRNLRNEAGELRIYYHFSPEPQANYTPRGPVPGHSVNANGGSTMFGGNFVYSGDSRMNAISNQPISVHDRYEDGRNITPVAKLAAQYEEIEVIASNLAQSVCNRIQEKVIPNDPAPIKTYGEGSAGFARDYCKRRVAELLTQSI